MCAQLLFRDMERRQEQGIDVDGPIDAEAVRHQQSAAGPAMMFIELKHKATEAVDEAGGGGGGGGVAYSEAELVDLSGLWKELLWTGGLEVSFYYIEESKMLVSLKKGWDGKPVKDFLLSKPETAKVTWDSHDYHPGDLDDDRGNGDERPARKAKKKAGGKKQPQKKKAAAAAAP
jgi:hypothetical protein